MRHRYLLLLYVAVVCFNGCASVADYRYLYSKKMLAWSAWRSAKSEIPDEKNTRDFAKGYKAGFLDVSRGGDGTPPPVAPKEYWAAKYSCGNDCGAINLWYEGFYYGAHAALCGNYQNCYAVPSRGSCECVAGCEACGLETNQVIHANPNVEPDKRFTPVPEQNPSLGDSRFRPEAGPIPVQPQESIESSPSEQAPAEKLPAEETPPTDGL